MAANMSPNKLPMPEQDLYAHFNKLVHFLLNDLFGETELRNTIDQNAAGLVESFENCDFITESCQVACSCKTCGACTENCNLLAVGLRLYDLGSAVLHDIVSNKALKTADTYGIALDAADTFAFALALLRTYTAAYCGQRACLRDNIICLSKLALGNESYKVGDFNIYGATAYARLIFAVEAACSLFHSHFSCVAQSNFFKILIANQRILLRHRQFVW